MSNFLQASMPMNSFKTKAETYLAQQFPTLIDSGKFVGVSVGRNKDSTLGDSSRHVIRASPDMYDAINFEIPSRMFDDKLLADTDSKKRTVDATPVVSDSLKEDVRLMLSRFMDSGITKDAAQSRVAELVRSYGYFDVKDMVFKHVKASRTTDGVLSGLMTPYWDISRVNKIYRTPMLTGYAGRMVQQMGIPNIYADFVQIFTGTYEGMARISNVAKAMPEFNTSIGMRHRTGTMLSEVINMVIDYESPNPSQTVIGGMEGNWLTDAMMGDNDKYAALMLENLQNILWYFGNAETGFEGLTQIASRDGTYTAYPDDKPPASYMWEHDGTGAEPVNTTVGADLLLMLNHLIADKCEELLFLPVRCVINCSPTLYKTLKFSMLSKTYNQNSPLSIIKTAFDAGNAVRGTLATDSFDGLQATFELTPDPMLMPNTALNDLNEDLLFITFPEFQSALDNGDNTDLVMAPVPIKRLILPSAPGYRRGIVRTQMRRIGSLLCPVEKTVHCVTGMGFNTRYVPPAP